MLYPDTRVLKYTLVSVIIMLFIGSPMLFAEETDLFQIPLEELLNVKVKSASLFSEDERVAAAVVSVKTNEEWEKSGCRLLEEVFENEIGIYSYAILSRGRETAIRGYSHGNAGRGIAYLMDGIPLNMLKYGSRSYSLPVFELGTLQKIEVIKGPNSAIYGTDAFHGVVSIETFESDEDFLSMGAAGGYPSYGDANLKLSRGLYDDRIRINITASGSKQGDLHSKYPYDDAVLGESGTGERADEYSSGAGVFKITMNSGEHLTLKFSGYVGTVESKETMGFNRDGAKDKSYGLFTKNPYHMGSFLTTYQFSDTLLFENFLYYASLMWNGEIPLQTRPEMIVHGWYIPENRLGNKTLLKYNDRSSDIQGFIGYQYDYLYSEEGTAEKWVTIDGQGDHEPNEIDGKHQTRHSMFSHVKWNLHDQMIYVQMGLRMDFYENVGNQFTPRCALIALPTDHDTFKAVYARGFNSPNGAHIYGSTTVAPHPDIEPELFDDYELIYLHSSENSQIRFILFTSKWSNVIASIPYSDPDDTNINLQYDNNGAESYAYGCETGITFRLLSHLKIDTGYGYTMSKIDQDGEDIRYKMFPEHMIHNNIVYFSPSMNIEIEINNLLYLNWYDADNILYPELSNKLDNYWRTDVNITKDISKNGNIILSVRDIFNRENHAPSYNNQEDGVVENGITIILRGNYTF